MDLDTTTTAKNPKEAILILPGFGLRFFGNADQEAYFSNRGYDVFIPKYVARKSLGKSLENLSAFIEENKLHEYAKLHVFSYIIGSWVLNEYIRKNPDNNIHTVLYDRSPLQERAPYTIINDIPLASWLAFGPITWELAKTPYTPIDNSEQIEIGILIESKATKVIRKHKETALEPGEIRWDISSLNQPCDDFFYHRLDHDQMYSRFDVIGEEIFCFIRTGNFSDTARREPFTWDYYQPSDE